MFKKHPSQYAETNNPRLNAPRGYQGSQSYGCQKLDLHHRRRSSIFSTNDRCSIPREMSQLLGGEKDFNNGKPIFGARPQREDYQYQECGYDDSAPGFQDRFYQEREPPGFYRDCKNQYEANAFPYEDYPDQGIKEPTLDRSRFYQETRAFDEPNNRQTQARLDFHYQEGLQLNSPFEVSRAIGRDSMFDFGKTNNSKSSMFFNDKTKRMPESYENNENIRAYLKTIDARIKKDFLQKDSYRVSKPEIFADQVGKGFNVIDQQSAAAEKKAKNNSKNDDNKNGDEKTNTNFQNHDNNKKLELNAKQNTPRKNESQTREGFKSDEKRTQSESGRKKVYKIKWDRLKNDGRSENVDDSICDKIPDVNSSTSMKSTLSKKNLSQQNAVQSKAPKNPSDRVKVQEASEKPPIKTTKQPNNHKKSSKAGKKPKIWGDETKATKGDNKSEFGDVSNCFSTVSQKHKTLSRDGSAKNLIFSPIPIRVDESGLLSSSHHISIIPVSPPANFKPLHQRTTSLCTSNKPNDFVCLACGKSLPINFVSEHPKECLGKSTNLDENNFFTFKKQRASELCTNVGKSEKLFKDSSNHATQVNKRLLEEYNKNLEKSDHSTSRWEIDMEIRALANKLRESVCSQMEKNKENDQPARLDSYVNDIIKTSEIILGASNQPLTLDNLMKITELIQNINVMSKKAGEQVHSLSKNLGSLVSSKATFLKQENAKQSERSLKENEEKLKSVNSSLTSSVNNGNQSKVKIKVRNMSDCASEKSLGELHVIKTQNKESDLVSEFEK